MKKERAYQYKLILKRCEESFVPFESIIGSKGAEKIARIMWDDDSIGITESFYCLFLNKANKPVGWCLHSTGVPTGCLVDVKLILHFGINLLAQSVILFHNHPSGNLEPSSPDLRITREIKAGCDIVAITVMDHIILAPESGYYSMADEGQI